MAVCAFTSVSVRVFLHASLSVDGGGDRAGILVSNTNSILWHDLSQREGVGKMVKCT